MHLGLKNIEIDNSKTPTFVFKKQLKWKPRLLKSKDNERKYSETHARGTYLEET